MAGAAICQETGCHFQILLSMCGDITRFQNIIREGNMYSTDVKFVKTDRKQLRGLVH